MLCVVQGAKLLSPWRRDLNTFMRLFVHFLCVLTTQLGADSPKESLSWPTSSINQKLPTAMPLRLNASRSRTTSVGVAAAIQMLALTHEICICIWGKCQDMFDYKDAVSVQMFAAILAIFRAPHPDPFAHSMFNCQKNVIVWQVKANIPQTSNWFLSEPSTRTIVQSGWACEAQQNKNKQFKLTKIIK